MSNARACALVTASASFVACLAGCATGLPELPTATANGPKYAELVSNIECELATVVNQPLLEQGSFNKRLAGRLALLPDQKRASELLKYLAKFNFVAAVQLSLEVTDNEGASPSLSFMNTPQIFALGIGGQWSGTQDRTTTASYPIDLRRLLIDTPDGKAISAEEMERALVDEMKICTRAELHRLSTGEFKAASDAASAPSTGSGLAGDLGLADIIVDGMTALDAAAANNVYSTLGPALVSPSASFRDAVHFESLNGAGHAARLSGKDSTQASLLATGSEFEGVLQLAPQAPGAQGSASLLGKFVVAYEKPGGGVGHAGLLANLSGATISPEATDKEPLYFSLSGNFLPVPGDADAQSLYHNYGFDSSVTLVGSVMLTGGQYHFPGLKLEGSLSPASSAASASEIHLNFVGAPRIKVPHLTSDTLTFQYFTPEALVGKGGPKPSAQAAATPAAGGGGGGGAKAGGASQGGSGGTTFGSLVDFVVVYGVSGGPNWTYKRFKGPEAAGGSLLSYTKTKTDSLTISFAGACQDDGPLVVSANSYWQSLPVCDALGSSKASSQASGFQNNSLMILRNTLQQR
jgi:hypothetical protein